jgi:hypothetical protein
MPSKIRKSRAGKGYARNKTYLGGSKPAWLHECPTLPDWVIEMCSDLYSGQRNYTRIREVTEKVLRELRRRKQIALTQQGLGGYWPEDDEEVA